MLTALVAGSRAVGVELDAELVALARASVRALNLDDRVRVDHGDARTHALPEATAYYLYVPFTGATLDAVLDRLGCVAARRPIVVCAQPLDTNRHPWLRRVGDPSSWLDVYRSAPP